MMRKAKHVSIVGRKKSDLAMIYGRNVGVLEEILEFEGNLASLYIKTHTKLWKNWTASQKTIEKKENLGNSPL